MGAPRCPRTPEAPRSSTPPDGEASAPREGGVVRLPARASADAPPDASLVYAWCTAGARPGARLHTSTNTLPPPPCHHTQTHSTQAHTHATPAQMQHADPPHSTPTPKRVVPRASLPTRTHAHTHTPRHPHTQTPTHPQHSPTNTQTMECPSFSLCVWLNQLHPIYFGHLVRL